MSQQVTVMGLITAHGVEIDPHLDREAMVPVSSGLQRQGDILVIPAAMCSTSAQARTVVSPAGFPVVRGEAGGNTHLLLADGAVRYDVSAMEGQNLGLLTVEPGSVAYLAHPEHGYAGIAPGSYVIRRQRERADEIRMVAD